MKRTRTTIAALGLGAAAVITPAAAGLAGSGADAAPAFKTPLPCNFTANANLRSGHSPANAIDYQTSGTNINGQPALASAAGTVSVVGNEGSTSYGRWIEIDHGDGYKTRYAHLSSQSVSKGQKVNAGTKIGVVGSTGGSTGPHLHYEQRKGSTVLRPTVDGRSFTSNGNFTVKSQNCGGTPTNPHTPQKICGSGFSVIDQKALGKAGRVYLLYNGSTKENCVTTLKTSALGKKTAISSTLQVKGGATKTDKGSFQYYAGPVKAKAGSTCVKWGGATGGQSYTSPFEHCG